MDYNSMTPEELSKLHTKKMERVQSMIDKIATNPSTVSVDDMMKALGYSNTDVTDQ